MATPFIGKYTNTSIFSLKKRYYVMQAQRNKPLLDSEVRELSLTNLHLTNWLARNSYGDLAVLSWENSQEPSARSAAFGCGPVDPLSASSDNVGNFQIFGGSNNNGVNDRPAVMYLKGWYIFLSSDILYKDQDDDILTAKHLGTVIKEYPSESIPDENSSEEDKLAYVMRSDTYSKESAPAITSGVPGQVDLIYVEITLDEVTGQENVSADTLRDPSLVDPVVATDTANRVRASVVYKVQQNWTGPVNEQIFSDPFFDEGTYTPAGVRYLRAPIGYVTLSADHPDKYNAGDFTDLLTLFNKRVLAPSEISFRLTHGGFTQNDVDAGRATPQDLDETWGATGQNKGLETEAYNTSSVTPRVLSKTSDFRMQSLAVAGVTGPLGATGIAQGTIQPDARFLEPGEITSKKNFADRSFLRGLAGVSIEEARELSKDSLSTLDSRGMTGGQVAQKVLSSYSGMASHWKQEADYPSGTTGVSEMTWDGRLALGKVSPEADRHLDVAGESLFRKGTDFLADDNQFHQGMGVSGTARIHNLSFDRQSFRFVSAANTYVVPPTPDYSLSDYRFWKCVSITPDPLEPKGLSFTMTVGSLVEDLQVDRVFAKLHVAVLPYSPTPPSAIVNIKVLESQGCTLDNIKVQDMGSGTVAIYFGGKPSLSRIGFSVEDGISLIASGVLTGHGEGDPNTSGWVTAPVSVLGLRLSYAQEHFSELKALRWAPNILTITRGPTTPFSTLVQVASRPAPTGGSLNASQTFAVSIRRVSGPATAESYAHFRLNVLTSSKGTFLSMSDLTCSGDISEDFIGVQVKQPSLTTTHALALVLGPIALAKTYQIETAEIPDTGHPVIVGIPLFTLSGVEGLISTATEIDANTGTVITAVAPRRETDPTKAQAKGSYALATSADVRLEGTAKLELLSPAPGVTGTQGVPSILDWSGSPGSDGQVLSARGSLDKSVEDKGVIWKNASHLVVSNITALRSVSLEYGVSLVYVEGYYTPGDGGGGLFRKKTTAEADDGGIIIRHAAFPTMAWERVIEDNRLDAKMYGATASMSPLDRWSEIVAAVTGADTRGYTLVLSVANYLLGNSQDLTFPSTLKVSLEGARFFWDQDGGRPQLQFSGPTTVKSLQRLTLPHLSGTLGPRLVFSAGSLSEVRPEWWGGVSTSLSAPEDVSPFFTAMYEDLELGSPYGAGAKGVQVMLGGDPTSFESYYHLQTGTVSVTAPTHVIGGNCLYLWNGVGGVPRLSVASLFEAPNHKIFELESIDGGAWVDFTSKTNAKPNVTWFGVLPDVDVAATRVVNTDLLERMSVRYASSLTGSSIYFPRGTYYIGNYTLGIDNRSSISFANVLLDMEPGALLSWGSRFEVVLRGFASYLDNTKFDLSNTMTLAGSIMPTFLEGPIQVSWFKQSGDSDLQALRKAIASLLVSSRVTGVSSSLELQGETTERSRIWLEGSGRTYSLNGDLVFEAGAPAYDTNKDLYRFCAGIGFRNMTWECLSAGGAPPVPYQILTSRGPLFPDEPSWVRMYDVVFSDMTFKTAGTLLGVSDTLNIRAMSEVLFEKCSFRTISVKQEDITTNDLASMGLKFVGCSFSDSRVDVSSKIAVSSAPSSITSCNFANSQRHALSPYSVIATGDVAINNNSFKEPRTLGAAEGNSLNSFIKLVTYSATASFFTAPTVQGNNFVNGKITVEQVSGVTIQGNKFLATGYPQKAVRTADPYDTFIRLVPITLAASMENVSITGNTFSNTTPAISTTDGVFDDFHTYFEAVACIETIGVTTFDDNKIFDVIVKDNVATHGINVRATEVEQALQLSNVTSFADKISVSTPLDGRKIRLVGIPQVISVSARAEYVLSGFPLDGVIHSSAWLADATPTRNSQIYYSFRYSPYSGSAGSSASWVVGLPNDTLDKNLLWVSSYKTYTSRVWSEGYAYRIISDTHIL